MDIVDEWKKESVAAQHIQVFKAQIESGYPLFTHHILTCIPSKDRIVDVGCGGGAIYHVLKKEGRSNPYLGIDFSENMILNAIEESGNPSAFQVGDCRNLNVSLKNDILLSSGLLDIFPDGVALLNTLLSYRPKYAILARVKIQDNTELTNYSYYGIEILNYKFSRQEFEQAIRNNGYRISKAYDSKIGTTLLLKRGLFGL